jgi:hypothetical protein
VNILKRRLPDSSDLVLSIFKVENNEVAGTSLFAQKNVVNEEVFLKFNVTPYTVLLYVLLKVPAVESDLKLPSLRYVVRKILAFSVFLKSTLCELWVCCVCCYFLF